MDDRNLRQDAPPRQRAHFNAVIASLFASLLLLFSGDAFSRFHAGPTTAGTISRADSGQMLAVGQSDSRFLTASDQSRPKLRPWASGDDFLSPDIPTLWMCRHRDRQHVRLVANLSLDVSQPYWSRAPPRIQHSV